MSIIGNAAPAFSSKAAKNGEIVEISLSDYSGKWLCLFFYPLDFTFVCPTELVAFSDRAADFSAAGCEILGVSVDSAHTHMAWMRTPRADAGVGSLNYPLLQDLGGQIASDYDVLAGGGVAGRVEHSHRGSVPGSHPGARSRGDCRRRVDRAEIARRRDAALGAAARPERARR